MEYLEHEIGLVQEASYTWFPENNVSLDFNEMKTTVGGTVHLFIDFKMLDKDCFNVV